MRKWLRIIWQAVIEAIRAELAFRRFLRNLKENPPTETPWSDAVAKVTLAEWKAKVEVLGRPRIVKRPNPLIALRQQNLKNRKFKKHWPHGKHSG